MCGRKLFFLALVGFGGRERCVVGGGHLLQLVDRRVLWAGCGWGKSWESCRFGGLLRLGFCDDGDNYEYGGINLRLERRLFILTADHPPFSHPHPNP